MAELPDHDPGASRLSVPPEDAYRCFMGTEIEVLAIGNCYLLKEAQDPAHKLDYRKVFTSD